MYQAFTGGLGGIALAKHGKSRAINAENPHGEKGRGGMIIGGPPSSPLRNSHIYDFVCARRPGSCRT